MKKSHNKQSRHIQNALKKVQSAFVLFNQGKLKEALDICKKLLLNNPNDVNALNLTGIIKDRQNKKEDAIVFFKKASNLSPNNADILSNIGITSFELNNLPEAKKYLTLAIEKDPSSAKAWLHLANVSLKEKKLDIAVDQFKKSFKHNPTQAGVAQSIGVYSVNLGHFDEAKKYLEESKKLAPQNIETLNALGVVNQETENYHEAIVCYEQSLAIDNANAATHNNLGHLYVKLQESRLAKKHFLEAISIDPTHQNALNNLSMLELSLGDYINGWNHYQYRTSIQNSVYDPSPNKLPESISGEKILILKEQGIGDELFFLRFVDQLKSKGAIISYFPCSKLLPLLKPLLKPVVPLPLKKVLKPEQKPETLQQDLFNELLEELPNKSKYDLCIAVGDLPYLLQHNLVNNGTKTTFPPSLPLQVNQNALNKVKTTLAEFGPPPYIGITWRSGGIVNNKKTGSYYKEIDLAALCQVLKSIPGTIVIAQHNTTEEEINYISDQIKRPIIDASIYHENLEYMLSLLSLLKNYICVSNTNVHLRDCLGLPSDVLVCSPPEWRWLTKGKTSPWFPQSRIYRQEKEGSWEKALSGLKENLRL